MHAVAYIDAPRPLAQSGLAERLVALIPLLHGPSKTELRTRLPSRLRNDAVGGVSPAIEADRWVDEVGALLAVQAAREQCEALGVLVLLRYMPPPPRLQPGVTRDVERSHR